MRTKNVFLSVQNHFGAVSCILNIQMSEFPYNRRGGNPSPCLTKMPAMLTAITLESLNDPPSPLHRYLCQMVHNNPSQNFNVRGQSEPLDPTSLRMLLVTYGKSTLIPQPYAHFRLRPLYMRIPTKKERSPD